MKALLKRLFDLVFATIGLVCFAPVLAMVAVAVKLTDWGPVFYRQVRVGLGGEPFRIWKFRTMIVGADKLGPNVTRDGDQRITRVGRILRKTKLDELPQLWNVFVGEMSFVGPRPEVPRYVERYTPEQCEVLQYKPGITDLATLVFRDEESLLSNAENTEEFYMQHCVPRKIKLNLKYAKQANVLKDVWIILQTVCPYWLGVLSIYSLALAASFWFAYQLRFDFAVPAVESEQMRLFWFWSVMLKLLFLVWRRQVRGLLSYFSVPELFQIGSALTVALGIQVGVWYFSQGVLAPPRSIILLDYLLSFFLLCSVRLGFRLFRERSLGERSRPTTEDVRRVGIVGAGEVGSKLARELRSNRGLGRRVEFFFDDDPYKWHKCLHDIPIIGMPECLLQPAWADKVDEVIIAMPSAPPDRLEQVSRILSRASIPCRVVPSWVRLATGHLVFDDLAALGLSRISEPKEAVVAGKV